MQRTNMVHFCDIVYTAVGSPGIPAHLYPIILLYYIVFIIFSSGASRLTILVWFLQRTLLCLERPCQPI